MEEVRINGLIDRSIPDQVRGRELAREAITAAVFRAPHAPDIGVAAVADEALQPTLLSSSDHNVLVGFLLEMRSWAEIAIQLAASGHCVSVEGIVETIRNTIATAEQS
jgi:hypothetical protein